MRLQLLFPWTRRQTADHAAAVAARAWREERERMAQYRPWARTDQPAGRP